MRIFLIILISIIPIIFLGWLLISYKHLQDGKNKVNEAEGRIETVLTLRFSILMKIVETVHDYMYQEKGVVEHVVQLRQPFEITQASIIEKQRVTQQMDQTLQTIDGVVEQYPVLKTHNDFKNLQLAIQEIGSELQLARRIYNTHVSSYNQKVKLFPTRLVASLFRFSLFEFFETEEFKWKDIEIRFH